MSSKQITDHFSEAAEILSKFNQPENILKIEEAGKMIVTSFSNGGKVISCGNGGSMCDAMHFAEELTGRYRENRRSLPALSISDPSHLSRGACHFTSYQALAAVPSGLHPST